jgi:hypothetical protein
MNTLVLKYVAASIIICCTYPAIAQEPTAAVADSTHGKKGTARNFGLSFGASYSVLQLDASPYFSEANSSLYKAQINNNMGANIGVFIYQPLKEKMSLRFAADAHFLNAQIIYDTGNPNKEESPVFPLCIETPISIVYGRHFRYDVEATSLFRTGFIAGLRPVLPLKLFNNTQPILKSFNLNLDLGISQPKALKSSILRSELIFSFGLLNLIGKDTTSYKTNSINYLGRNFVAFKMYFN